MKVGIIPSKKFLKDDQFDEAEFQECREKQLANLLASDVQENEREWLNYDFEES
jgi:hypothetical protein